MSIEHTIYDELNNMNNMQLEEIYEQLVHKYPENIVNFVMDDEYGYIHTKAEERKIRTDTQFKADVKKRYNNRCIISGSSATTQVCHIKPFSECSNDEKYDVNNGILLRDDLHTLFDKKYIIIDPDTLTVKISDNIMDNPNDSCYHCYNNITLNINEYSKKYLQKKYE